MLKRSEVVTLSGANIYYEVYGKGEPLLLLHGYTLSSRHWLPYVADYTNDYEVYLIDLKGHGKSSPFTENLSIRSAAKDVDALIRYLNLDNINAIGFSYGGDVLFQLALLCPGLIKSMIAIGACGSWNVKDNPDWLEFFSYENISNLEWMYEHQTGENRVRSILEQMPNYNVQVSDAELKSIGARTLVVLGDKDVSIPLEEVARVKNNVLRSYLWILPNTGHGAHEGKNKKEFIRVSKEFFGQGWSTPF